MANTNPYKLIYPLQSLEPEKKSKTKPSKEARKKVKEATKENTQDAAIKPEKEERAVDRLKRPTLPVCNNKRVLSNVEHIKHYLRDTGVAIAMKKLTVELLQSQVLPYNPFPGYTKRFRRLAENFHTKQKSLDKLKLDVSQCSTFQTSTGILSGIKSTDVNIWGLKHILSSTNPKILQNYELLVKNCSVPDSIITEICGNDVNLILSIFGPFLFSGSVYPNVFRLDLNATVVISNSNSDFVNKRFALIVIEDLKHVIKSENQILLKFEIISSGNVTQWLVNDVKNMLESATLRGNFMDTITESIESNSSFTLTSIFRTDSAISKTSGKIPYLPSEKTYNLISEQPSDKVAEKNYPVKLVGMSISNLPYQDIHGSVFFERGRADYYMTFMKKHTNAKSPLYAPVLSAMKTLWKEIISSSFIQENPMKILHNLYLLDKLQNLSKTSNVLAETDVAVQIARLCHGSAYKLFSLTPINSSLQLLLQSNQEGVEKYESAIDGLLKTYSYFLLNSFFLHEYSADVASSKAVLTEIMQTIHSNIKKKEPNNNSIKLLQFIKEYTEAIAFILLDDGLEAKNVINVTKHKINAEANTLSNDPETLGIIENPTAFVHKLKNTHFLNADTLLLDLNKCAASGNAPKNIAMESVMMQYCVDMHIDDVWQEYLETLFLKNEHLPPNPHPQLVSILRHATMKVQLFRDTDLNTAKRLLQTKFKLYDVNNKIYTVPGIRAFGSLSSIKVVNLNGFRQIQSMAENLLTVRTFSPEEGSEPIHMQKFEIKCTSAMSSETLIYGSASPYLFGVNLNEHCFIRGPNNADHSGITALSKIIVSNIQSLMEDDVLPCEAHFGSTVFDISDLNNVQTRLQDELIGNISASKLCTVTVLVKFDWRYILVKKNYFVYYINENSEKVSKLTDKHGYAKRLQIFFNVHDALYYSAKTSSFKNRANDPDDIKHAWKSRDWTLLSTLILDRGVKVFDKDGKLKEVDFSLISFAWKYFHSTAGDLYYCKCLSKATALALQHLAIEERNTDYIHGLVEKMIIGYKHKLNILINSASSLLPAKLNFVIQRRLQLYCNVDIAEEKVTIHNTNQLIKELDDINNFLDFFLDSSFKELLEVSPSVKKITDE